MGRKIAAIGAAAGGLLLLVGGGWLAFSIYGKAEPQTILLQPVASQIKKADGPAAQTAAATASLPPTTSNDPSIIALDLQSKDTDIRDEAVREIRALAITDPRSMAIGLPQWIQPLLDAKQYVDADETSRQAILERSFEVSTVEMAQRARVIALIGQENFPDGLVAAKSYYNIVSLPAIPEAKALLMQCLAKTIGPAAATQFAAEQQEGKNSAGVLEGIKVPVALYENAIAALDSRGGSSGKYSVGNRIGLGTLLLLADRPAEAQKCFVQACKVKGNNVRYMRQALEGIAKSLHAEDSTLKTADAFFSSLWSGLPVNGADALLQGNMPNAANLRPALQQVMAELKLSTVPPLEEERARQEVAALPPNEQIEVTTGFEGSVPLEVQRFSPTHLGVTIESTGLQDWFMFQIHGVAGKTIRIDLTGARIEMNKWSSLNPVFSYVANLDDLDTYAQADLKDNSTEAAWNGSLLSPTLGQKWHFIKNVFTEQPDVLSIVQSFDADSAFIAMRVPFLPSYNEQSMRRLAKSPAVQVVEVGRSGGRALLLAKIGTKDGDAPSHKPCVLIYAGEHADEPDSMWVAQGAIDYLIGDTHRAKELLGSETFLVIPNLDPYSTANGQHEGLVISNFLVQRRNAESIAYANWFQNWVNSGNRLDLIIDLHNLQSGEGPHLSCPLIEGVGVRSQASFALHRIVLQNAGASGFTSNPIPWQRGWSPERLGGWLSRYYGPITIAYEINSQSPDRHLNIMELKDIGRVLVDSAGQFVSSPMGAQLMTDVDARRRQRAQLWAVAKTSIGVQDAIQSESDATGADKPYGN